jgi:hypothetical protein
MAEMSHPQIVPQQLPVGHTSSQYRAQVEVSASIGHLVSQDENGRAYQMRFRNGDDLLFELEGAPGSLVIDSDSGLISGYLPAGSEGKYVLKVKVSDRRTGHKHQMPLQLEVQPGH